MKRWSRCALCKQPTPSYEVEVDHIVPVVSTDTSLEATGVNELVDRIFCDPANLQACCKPCHKRKSKVEAAERARLRKLKKLNTA